MLGYEDLKTAQTDAITRLYETDETFLYAPMGAGKTIVGLTALSYLIADGVLKRPLIIASKKICDNVWRQEAKKWAHTKHLHIVMLDADNLVSRVEETANDENGIFLCGNDNVVKLFKQPKASFDGLLIDELSLYGEPGGARFKALRRERKKFAWVCGMTGTPVHEAWTKLYAQCLLVDQGARLGRNKEKFLRRFFYPTDYQQRKWALLPLAEGDLMRAIGGLIYSMPDYRHELPELIETDIEIDLSAMERKVYDDMAGEMLVNIGDDVTLAETTASMLGKLHQISQGFLYNETGDPIWLETIETPSKLKALEELLNTHKGLNEPVVVLYWFRAERECLKRLNVEFVEDAGAVERWNAGRVPVLALHPASAAHGLNLAAGGAHMIFLSQIWSNDRYSQAVARLWRQGQTKPVTVTHIIARDTIDETMRASRAGKEAGAEIFDAHIRALRRRQGASQSVC